MPPTKRTSLSDPIETRLRRRDMTRVREIADHTGEALSTVIRDLVGEAIQMRDRRDVLEEQRPGLKPIRRRSNLPTGPEGIEGQSSTKIGKAGKKGPTMDTIPQTIEERDRRAKRPKYEITAVSQTSEEEI